MYEVTVSTPTEQNYLLDHISANISGYLGQVDGTFASIERKHRSYFCLACKDTFRFQIQRMLEEEIAQVLSLGYKNIFVRHLLDIEDANFYQNVLIDTMCAFDHKLDANIIANLVDSNNNIFVDGYYNFRLGGLKRKWKNVVDMIAENDYILYDNQLILEFLQYLMQSVGAKTQQLSICFEDNDYTLFDSTGKVIDKLSIFSPATTLEQSALVNAIYQNAQQLKVYHSETLSADFCDLSRALFDVQFVQVT